MPMAIDSSPNHVQREPPAASNPSNSAPAAQAEEVVDARNVMANMHKECRNLDLVRILLLSIMQHGHNEGICHESAQHRFRM